MNNLLLPARDLLELIFPSICIGCKSERPLKNDIFCLKCSLELPDTDHHLIVNNELYQKFTGRVNLESARALFYFSKSGVIQKAIHALKYKSDTKVGIHFGKLIGSRLLNLSEDLKLDAILPVPMHYKKQVLRGYNQAEIVSKGITQILNLPILNKVLINTAYSESQTSKSRIERFENVLNSFELKSIKNLTGKHILVVDDVFTTGATLEACVTKLQPIPDIRISVAVVAMAQ